MGKKQPFAFSSPNLNFEFYDGAAWYTLATQSYVNSSVFNINTNTSGQLAISRLNGYPASTATFLRGDGSWNYVNLSANVTGSLPIANLSGYPNSSSYFLRGDGNWSQVSLASNVTGSLPIANLSGYPANAAVYLSGNGTWTTPSTSSPYINSLPINGTLNLSSYGLTTNGNVSAQTGTLQANNLAAYNSGSIVCGSGFALSGYSISNVGTLSLSTLTAASSYISCTSGLVMNNNVISSVGALYLSTLAPVASNITCSGGFIIGNNKIYGDSVGANNYFYCSGGTWYFSSGITTGVNYSSYGYLNGSGNTGTASGTNYYSIICQNRIKALEFNAVSSRKIKQILGSGETIEAEALEAFKQLCFSKYAYKDQVAHGDAISYGVIAEEVELLFPGYIQRHDAFVPNVLKTASVRLISKGIYELTFTDDLADIEGNLLKIFTTDKEITGTIISVTPQRIRLQCDEALADEVFVYGAYESCPAVTKNKLFELAMVVLKNVLRRLETIESTNIVKNRSNDSKILAKHWVFS